MQRACAGSEALGGALMSLFFVTIGAAAGSLSAILSTGWLLLFISIQLACHLGFTIGLGKLLNLPIQVLHPASSSPSAIECHFCRNSMPGI